MGRNRAHQVGAHLGNVEMLKAVARQRLYPNDDTLDAVTVGLRVRSPRIVVTRFKH